MNAKEIQEKLELLNKFPPVAPPPTPRIRAMPWYYSPAQKQFRCYDGQYIITASWVEDSNKEYEYLYMGYGCTAKKLANWPHKRLAERWAPRNSTKYTKHTKRIAEHIRECLGE